MPISRPIVATTLLLALAALPACRSDSAIARVNPGPTESGQQPRAYPEPSDRPIVHDVQVFREITQLRLTNTTANDFGPGTLWINRRYAHDVTGFAVGQTLELNLNDFIDEYGTSFKAGGFFATQAPDPVVAVEYQVPATPARPGVRHAFVVVLDDPE